MRGNESGYIEIIIDGYPIDFLWLVSIKSQCFC
jgi:hypothetical protein